MAKEKSSHRKKDGNNSQDAVLNLTIDGSFPDAEVREVVPTTTDAFQTPCSISGLMAGVSGGTLGYMFGFGKTPLNSNLRCIFPLKSRLTPYIHYKLQYFLVYSWILVPHEAARKFERSFGGRMGLCKGTFFRQFLAENIKFQLYFGTRA